MSAVIDNLLPDRGVTQIDDDWLFNDVDEASLALSLDDQREVGDETPGGSPWNQGLSVSSSKYQMAESSRKLPSSSNLLETFDMPPQLHPAVSFGVRRVSSCYFSLGSQDSMADLLSQLDENSHHNSNATGDPGDDLTSVNSASDWVKIHAEDVFYHDVLMLIFNFLDAQSLKNFSETARRPNFEVFYYLQLQLQQALLVGDGNKRADTSDGDRCQLSTIAGSAYVSRLARVDMIQAQNIVNEFLESNSTLRTMPLSHSLAYARRFLLHNGFSRMFPNSKEIDNTNATNKALASAVLFMTVVGAASLVSTVSGGDTTVIASSLESFGNELPNVLFRVGFVGSIMGAARQLSDTEQRAAMREKAEQMTRSMQEFRSSLIRGNASNQSIIKDTNKESSQPIPPLHFRLPTFFEIREQLQTTLGNFAAQEQQRSGMLSNPYDHLPVATKADRLNEEKRGKTQNESNVTFPQTSQKMPSGCVGAYARAIEKSSRRVMESLKDARKSRFEAKSTEEQHDFALQFLNACSSNDLLETVKSMIHDMNVDGFFVGNDGTETCALHTAAFHGADRVVDFLCNGIDESNEQHDGGLCDINSKDSNGWTALHFAAGANSAAVVRVLARHGALLHVEAQNGYTPLQWAIRLSNEELAQILTGLMAEAGTDHRAWISSQPLTSLANRFFSLIPTTHR